MLATVVVYAIATSAASAAEQVWGFKGTLTSYVAGPGYGELADVPVGSTVRGQVLFDDTTADADGSPTSGSYPYTLIALGLDGVMDLHIGLDSGGTIGIKDDDPLGGGIFRDAIGFGGGFFYIASLTMWVASLDFHINEDANPAPTVLSSDALPIPPPPLSSFTTDQLLNVIGYTQVPSANVDFDVAITEFGEVGTPDLPLIPDSVTVNPNGSVTWTFKTLGISLCVAGGCWVDPPAATGFTYTMTNAALFTGIADFPAGFGNALDVSVGGQSLGTFGPGGSVDFTTYPGGGVSEFVVSGITPPSDVSSAESFPLSIVFDSAGAEFTMTSIPAGPAVPLLGWPAAAGLTAVLLAVGSVALRRRG
jgi:hypothetical protein